MGILDDFEAKVDLANKKLDVLIAKIDSLLGVVPLADTVDITDVSVVTAEVSEAVERLIGPQK